MWDPKPTPTIPHVLLFREQSLQEAQSMDTARKRCFFCSPGILSQQLSTSWAVPPALQLKRMSCPYRGLGHDATYQKLNQRRSAKFWANRRREIPRFGDKVVCQDTSAVAGKPSGCRSAPHWVTW